MATIFCEHVVATAKAKAALETRKPKRLSGDGFTLIELLVVVAIISVLIAITLPALSGTREAARKVQCGSNLRQLAFGMNMYADDYRNWYPRALPLPPGGAPEDPIAWQTPWPHNLCPLHWGAGYPALVAPYLGVAIVDPHDVFGLMSQLNDTYRDYLDCPSNEVPADDLTHRKCGYPLDYGMANRASSNRRDSIGPQRAFLATEATWGLAHVEASGGPHPQAELRDWWVLFPHSSEGINVADLDGSVRALSRPDFCDELETKHPPADDQI